MLPGQAAIGNTGVQSPLDIEINSSGAAQDFAFITVSAADGDTQDASAGRRGYNLTSIDPQTGEVLDVLGFDTWANEFEAERMADFVETLPEGAIVLAAARDDASRFLTDRAVAALASLGSAVDLRATPGYGHTLIGVKGAAPGSRGRGCRAGGRLPARRRRPSNAGRGSRLDTAGARAMTAAAAAAGVGAEKSPQSGVSLLPRWDLATALLLGALAGVIYTAGSAPGVLPADSGELQFAGWLAGLPHPTGYPFYMILAWGWSHLLDALNLASPARALNLLSALAGCAAVALTALFFLELTRQVASRAGVSAQPSGRWLERIAVAVATLTFTFSTTFWSQATVAEVYTLHAALTALILWLALLWARDTVRGDGSGTSWLLYPLALASGLALAHHRTSLLLLPVLAVHIWGAPGRGYWRTRGRSALAALGLALLPLLLYLYIPLRAGHSPYLVLALHPGQPMNLLDRSTGGLWDYFLGRGFAGELKDIGYAASQATGLLARLAGQITWVGVILALAGAVTLAARRIWWPLWLTAGSLTAFALFNFFYAIGDIAVFYVPVTLIACGWMAVALTEGSQVVNGRRSKGGATSTKRWPGLALICLAGLLPLALFASQAANQNRSRDISVEEGWRAILTGDLPQNAVLVSNDRDEMTPLWYLQQVEGVQKDVAGVFPLLLPEPAWENLGRTLDSALATGRPVYLIKPMPGLEVKAALQETPGGRLVAVTGLTAASPSATPVNQPVGESLTLAAVDTAPSVVSPGTTLQVDLTWQVTAPVPGDYTSFVQLLAPDGEKIAQSDHPVGGVFYPTSMWLPGETLRDRHLLSLPANAPARPYRLLAGLYLLDEGGIVPVGQVEVSLGPG